MARIAGVDLPREKRVEIGLTYIYGIGRVSADRILEAANVDPSTRVRDLTDDEVKRISAVIDETMTVEGDLRREIALNIKRLQEIGCYRGIRHRKGLPVRGQNTKNNARSFWWINSSTGRTVSNLSFSISKVAFETRFAIINSSKSIGYILNTDKYPTGAEAIPFNSTPNKDPLMTYLKLPSSTRNLMLVTISGHF